MAAIHLLVVISRRQWFFQEEEKNNKLTEKKKQQPEEKGKDERGTGGIEWFVFSRITHDAAGW